MDSLTEKLPTFCRGGNSWEKSLFRCSFAETDPAAILQLPAEGTLDQVELHFRTGG